MCKLQRNQIDCPALKNMRQYDTSPYRSRCDRKGAQLARKVVPHVEGKMLLQGLPRTGGSQLVPWFPLPLPQLGKPTVSLASRHMLSAFRSTDNAFGTNVQRSSCNVGLKSVTCPVARKSAAMLQPWASTQPVRKPLAFMRADSSMSTADTGELLRRPLFYSVQPRFHD